MKNLKTLLLVSLACAVVAFAQPAGPNITLNSGTATASTRLCNDAVYVGSIWTQVGTNPSITSICWQTGSSSLGQGAYGWVPAQITTTSGGGTLVIVAGKTFTVDKTLELDGTDSTKFTFPATSDTVVTLGATQTLTAKTLTTPTITAPVIATVTNTGTETLPSTTGGIPVVIACGNTTTGSGTCANTTVGATSKVYFGNATLASNAQTVTISPGFTSSSTFQCVGNDQTTRANPVQVVPASATTFTITNTTGASDVIQWICVGN